MAGNVMKFDAEQEVYYDDAGDGPFCPVCWDSDRKRVHLIKQGAQNHFHCIVHKIYFAKATGRHP